MADAGRRPPASATPICSARARRSSTGPGSRPRTAPASARPGRRGSPRPSRLKVVMSGERLTPEGEPAGEGRRAYPLPDGPSGRALSDRDRRRRHRLSRARAAHRRLDRAGDARRGGAPSSPTPSGWSTAAEQLYGPYRWGRYDMIVLPPSFPYGGMENPTLTFLTPTFIAGDRSLVGLVAHELAHSWSGNLVTNATWSDVWLNEGFTSYFENRIMEALYGPRARRAGGGPVVRRHGERVRRARPRRAGDAAARRATIPTTAPAASSTTRARPSCARSSGSSGASAGTPTCAPISTATPSSR